MTSYRYLGYGVTDSNGVAHLKKNAKDQDIDGYTGVGAGEIDIIASLDKPIVDGSIVSVPCNVLDALFYEQGTTGTPNSKWVKNGGNFTATSDDTGLKIQNDFTWAVYYRADLTNDASTRDYSAPFMVEFDLEDYSGTGNNTYISFDDGQSNYPALRFDGTDVTKGCHITLKVLNDGTYYKVDNGTERSLNKAVTGNCHVSFQMAGGTDKYIVFKNFKVYPI